MDQNYEQILTHLERAVNLLARQVPGPKLIDFGDFRAFRYEEKTIYQAIVQKLARMVSTLDAARLLLNNGFVQEQASLQRILGEIQEDISFLFHGVLQDDHQSSLHRSYLEAFFEEEFDTDTAIESTQKRPMISRQKIQAYLARTKFSDDDPSTGKELLRTNHKMYSGYVHAASPHIMDMYEGNSGQFHMRGMLEHPAYNEYKQDLWNYFYRGIVVCSFGAEAFGDKNLFKNLLFLSEELSATKQTSPS